MLLWVSRCLRAVLRTELAEHADALRVLTLQDFEVGSASGGLLCKYLEILRLQQRKPSFTIIVIIMALIEVVIVC